MNNLKSGIKKKKYISEFNIDNKSIIPLKREYDKTYNTQLVWFLNNTYKRYYGKNKKLLDIGSSHGKFGWALRKDKGLDFQYICLDIRNCEIGTPHKFIQHDIRDTLPLNKNEMNQVIMFDWNTADIWDIDYKKLFKDIHRVMKKKGLFYVDFPSTINDYEFTGGGGGTMKERENIVDIIESCGFKLLIKNMVRRTTDAPYELMIYVKI